MDAKQNILEEFEKEFGPKLKLSQRWSSLCYMMGELEKLGRPVRIGETGCAREADNWNGDGQSTLIWDWVIEKLGGEAWSVDLDPKAVEYARSKCKHVKIFEGDSILFLQRYPIMTEKLDLLYFDSYDWNEQLHWKSSFHHMAEVSIAFMNLPQNAMLAIDDCHGEYMGKHAVVKRCFDGLGLDPSHQGYVTIWRKPV